MVQVYAGKQRVTQAPHLFAIAEESFMYGSVLAAGSGCRLLTVVQGHVAG